MHEMMRPWRSHDVAFMARLVAVALPVYLHARPVLSIVIVASTSFPLWVTVTVPRSVLGRKLGTTAPAHSPPLVASSAIGPLQTPSTFGMNREAAVGIAGRSS